MKEVPLDQVCEIQIGPFGSLLHQEEYTLGGVPLVNPMHIVSGKIVPGESQTVSKAKASALNRYRLRVGDVIMGRRGEMGRCATVSPVEDGMLCGTGSVFFRPDPLVVCSDYLCKSLSSDGAKRRLESLSQGVTMPNLNRTMLRSFPIPLPPLAEQKRIAAILDAADALRAKRREALAQLDALLQSSFLTLFGDPVSNERKWPVHSINDFVAGFESGKSIVSDDESDTTSPYRVLKVSAVTSLEFRPEQSKAMPPLYKPPHSHIVRAGDLLFSRANTIELIGATAYVPTTPPNLLLPDKLWRFVWYAQPKAEPHFVRLLFQQLKFRREIGQRASGTSGSMKNISQNKVLTIKVGLPPLPLQQKFAAIVESIERQKTTQRAHLAELDALFAALQHRAFRGEL